MDIKKARKMRNMTQEELAKKLKINRATLSKYETGSIDPPFSMMKEIARILSLDELMTTEDAENVIDALFNNDHHKKRLAALRANDDSRLIESQKKRQEQRTQEASAFVSSRIGAQIIEKFFELNQYGQQAALDRIEELTFLPQFSAEECSGVFEDYATAYLIERGYIRLSDEIPPEWKSRVDNYLREFEEEATTDPIEPLPEDQQGKPSTTQEKPPEGQINPKDGK